MTITSELLVVGARFSPDLFSEKHYSALAPLPTTL